MISEEGMGNKHHDVADKQKEKEDRINKENFIKQFEKKDIMVPENIENLSPEKKMYFSVPKQRNY